MATKISSFINIEATRRYTEIRAEARRAIASLKILRDDKQADDEDRINADREIAGFTTLLEET